MENGTVVDLTASSDEETDLPVGLSIPQEGYPQLSSVHNILHGVVRKFPVEKLLNVEQAPTSPSSVKKQDLKADKVTKSANCTCTKDGRCLQCCMNRKRQAKREIPSNIATKSNEKVRKLTSECVKTSGPRIYSGEKCTGSHLGNDVTHAQDYPGSVIDADENFVYLLNESKVKVIPTSSAMNYEQVSEFIKKKNKIQNDTDNEKPSLMGASPLQELALISQKSFNTSYLSDNMLQDGNSSACVQYYGVIPMLPVYYYDNHGNEVDVNKLSTDLQNISGPLSKSTLDCHLCKLVFPDIHSLAHHKCSGIKEWRDELSGKWWKNFKS